MRRTPYTRKVLDRGTKKGWNAMRYWLRLECGHNKPVPASRHHAKYAQCLTCKRG